MRIFLSLLLSLSLLIPIQNSYGTSKVEYGSGRIRSCDGGTPGKLIFWDTSNDNPIGNSADLLFDLSNPVCLTVIVTSYTNVKAAIAAMNKTCGTGSALPRVTPSLLLDVADIYRAKSNSSPSCKVAIVIAAASVSSFLAQMGIIYGVANTVYRNTAICGAGSIDSSNIHGWYKPNSSLYNISTSDYKQTVEEEIEGYMEKESAGDSSASSLLSLDNKKYREWYYNGVEVEDDIEGDGEICRDPTAEPEGDYDSYPVQKYYMQGLPTGNFNCEKYNIMSGQNDPYTGEAATSTRLAQFQKAYNCCKYRSQNYICIEADYYMSGEGAIAGSNDNVGVSGMNNDNTESHTVRKFCKAGTKCTIQGITFSNSFRDNNRMICAETYSLCPYNFTIGGGSEYCDYYQDGIWNAENKKWDLITQDDIDAGDCAGKSDIRNADCSYNEKANKCQNYCQYLTHCTVAADSSYEYQSDLGSPYFSDACLNFVGDSLNQTSYNTGFILGSQRHFGAPVAQCVKETMENLFYNVAGHSRCKTINEVPAADGTCPSGEYMTDGNFIFKKGNTVKTQSFFSAIQDAMQDIVKMVLTLSIMFYGINLLIGKADIRQTKDILVYFLKIGLVLYFATGDAWQGMFFDGVYSASAEFSQMVFKIETGESELQRDGCQFGYMTLSDGTLESSGRTYDSGKEYLAIWDTLDCKLARYLGFGPEVSVATIASLIFAGPFTGSVGITFSLMVMLFGFFMIAAIIRALHVFLCSCIAIIMFVFISPIVIPLALFQRSKGIFDGWLKGLISFCFQPIILFAYIAIFIMAFDKTMIGSATFHGTAPSKSIHCEQVCKDSNGTIQDKEGCEDNGYQLYDPMNDSFACLINVKDFGKAPGLDMIGLTFPILENLLSTNVKERLTTLLKGFLVMYLLYKFMDEIPGITTRLIGGNSLPEVKKSSLSDPKTAFKKAVGSIRAIQKRVDRGGMKWGKKLGSWGMDKVGGLADKGKQTQIAEPKGQTHTTSAIRQPDLVSDNRQPSAAPSHTGANDDDNPQP